MDELNRLIRAEVSATARTARRLRVLVRRQSQIAQALRIQPWQLRRVKYLIASGRIDAIRDEGLTRAASELRSAA
jgi:RNase P/RNase MRP subunit p30